jgi:hypothetical protein
MIVVVEDRTLFHFVKKCMIVVLGYGPKAMIYIHIIKTRYTTIQL